MVYVDDLVFYQESPLGPCHWCHLWTDGELDELHRFAARIGLRRAWFQADRVLPHYDLVRSKREAAIKRGAAYMDLLEWAESHPPFWLKGD